MTTVVLVGHGSEHDSKALEPVYQHAKVVRDIAQFDAVHEAFVKGEPTVETVLGAVESGPAVVVPLLATDGYFAGTVLPRRLDAVRDSLTVKYTPPVGTHDAMTDVALRRIETSTSHPERVGVALVGHGSGRDSNSSDAVRYHAARLREREPFREVRTFFLEEEPRVEAVTSECDSRELVVVPMFMTEGHHVREDIPEKIGLTGDRGQVDEHTVRYTEPVGTHPAVAAIAINRVRDVLDGEVNDRLRASGSGESGTTSKGGS